MAANYRVIVHYHLKKGTEEQAIQFLENELINKGKDFGCHYIELWQKEKDPSILEGVAVWNDLEDAKRFQSMWETKENEFVNKFCSDKPAREFCKIRSIFMEKSAKRAA